MFSFTPISQLFSYLLLKVKHEKVVGFRSIKLALTTTFFERYLGKID